MNLIFGALGAKRLELLRDLIPQATAIAMLVNLNYPSASTEVQEAEAGARSLGLQLNVFNATTESEFERGLRGNRCAEDGRPTGRR